MEINPEIFRAYDIRGIYPKEINEKTAYLIGLNFPRFLKAAKSGGKRRPKIFISRDNRPSSPALFKALKNGLLEAGAKIVDGGPTTTPMHYFCVNKTKADGGIMVTASHLPGRHNGFKLSRPKAVPISGEEFFRFLKTQKNLHLETPFPSERKIIKKNFQKDYVEFLLKASGFSGAKRKIRAKKLSAEGGPAFGGKIVIDNGNGMAGLILRKLLKKLPIKFSILYEKPDCSFPNREANPIKEKTLKTLRKKISAEKADLGIAFDGDGDRLAFLDAKGKTIRADLTLVLLAAAYLKKRKKAKIAYDVRSSKIVPETIKKFGGVPLKCRVGHKFFKDLLKEKGAILGGELSGHFYFKKFFNADSAVLAMLEVLAALISANKPIEELIPPLRKYFHSGEINFKIKNKEAAMAGIKKRFSKNAKISEMDGLTFEYEDWWFNLRPSVTEPVVRLVVEAKARKTLSAKTKLLSAILKSY